MAARPSVFVRWKPGQLRHDLQQIFRSEGLFPLMGIMAAAVSAVSAFAVQNLWVAPGVFVNKKHRQEFMLGDQDAQLGQWYVLGRPFRRWFVQRQYKHWDELGVLHKYSPRLAPQVVRVDVPEAHVEREAAQAAAEIATSFETGAIFGEQASEQV